MKSPLQMKSQSNHPFIIQPIENQIVLSSLKIETIVDKVLFLADSLVSERKIVKTQVWVRGTRSTCVSSSTLCPLHIILN